MRMESRTPRWACHRRSLRGYTTNPPFNFAKKPFAILLYHGKPGPQLPVPSTIVFQPGNRERPRICFVVKQKWLAPAKVRDSRTFDRFREMPAGAATVLHEFSFSVMPPDVLQVRHGSFDFSALCHGVDMIVEHPHFSPCKEPGNLVVPRFNFCPVVKRYHIPSARQRAGRKVRMPAPIKFRIECF